MKISAGNARRNSSLSVARTSPTWLLERDSE